MYIVAVKLTQRNRTTDMTRRIALVASGTLSFLNASAALIGFFACVHMVKHSDKFTDADLLHEGMCMSFHTVLAVLSLIAFVRLQHNK